MRKNMLKQIFNSFVLIKPYKQAMKVNMFGK